MTETIPASRQAIWYLEWNKKTGKELFYEREADSAFSEINVFRLIVFRILRRRFIDLIQIAAKGHAVFSVDSYLPAAVSKAEYGILAHDTVCLMDFKRIISADIDRYFGIVRIEIAFRSDTVNHAGCMDIGIELAVGQLYEAVSIDTERREDIW